MANAYETLGRHIVGHYEAAALQEMLGDAASSPSTPGGPGAFNWSMLVNAAAEAANQGIAYDTQKKAAAAAAAASDSSAAKAIMSDAAWASAEQQLSLSPGSAPAQALQSQAMGAAMAAGAGLSADAQGKRSYAAQKAAKDAAQGALSAPGDLAKQALSKAWQKVIALSGSSSGAAGGGLVRFGGGSWFTTKHAGLPGWAWIAGGVTIPTALILIIRALRR